MNIPDEFWDASLEEMKKGFTEEEDNYTCLFCGKKIEKGIIYPVDGILFEAVKYMGMHIEKDHGSVFDFLINLDKKYTGLTEHQGKLLRLFYLGKNDEEVKKEMDIGSSSTIRNHRFVLKEKERQAKLFLTMMELLRVNSKRPPSYISPHQTAKMVDDRYKITEEENEKILRKFFPHGLNGPLKTFDMKEKNKLAVLRQIIKRFDQESTYSEKEVVEILKNVYEDHVTLRRYLIEYGFMDRTSDGSQYWLRKNSDEASGEKMDNINHMDIERKKELVRQYKEMKTEAGVYQIKNTKNQKVFLVATPNLRTINGRLMMLRGGSHQNKELQKEWREFGEDAFVIEVLEVLKEPEEGFFDKKDELKKLEEKWMEKLQPFGERGYN